MEMVNRFDILISALYAGGIYAAFRIVLTLFYPMTVNLVWQGVLGPFAGRRWPSLVQREDPSRLSYLPTDDDPAVVTIPVNPNIDDLTHGVRDGMALGLLIALLPEFYTVQVILVLLTFVVIHNALKIAWSSGSYKTDVAIVLLRRTLMWCGAVGAIYAAGIAH